MLLKTKKVLDEINELLIPYIHWDVWIHSEDCFLSSTQLGIFNSYRKYRSHHPYVDATGVTHRYCCDVVRIVRHKLRSKLELYQAWEYAYRAQGAARG